jgi:hypothetical protein
MATIRVEVGHRLLLEGLASGEANNLFDQLAVGAPVAGADAHVDTPLQSLPLQGVRAAWAGIRLDSHDVSPAPRHELDIGNEPRARCGR